MSDRTDRLWAAAVTAAVAAPIVVAAVRAVARGWYSVGDSAVYALRALAALGPHHPLLGTWSSASLSSGTDAADLVRLALNEGVGGDVSLLFGRMLDIRVPVAVFVLPPGPRP